MNFKMYTIFAFNILAFLYLITNMARELNFQSNDEITKMNHFHKTSCNIHDENMVCGSDLNFYPNRCVAKRNGITQYIPRIACEAELAKNNCK